MVIFAKINEGSVEGGSEGKEERLVLNSISIGEKQYGVPVLPVVLVYQFNEKAMMSGVISRNYISRAPLLEPSFFLIGSVPEPLVRVLVRFVEDSFSENSIF